MMFWKKLYAGRAAVCTQNTQEQIKTAVVTAYTRFLELNRLQEKDIVSLQFSSTEPDIDGSPHGIIRFLFYYYGKKKAIPVYLGGAEKLRPDLFNRTP